MTFVSYTWVTTMIVTVGFYWLLPTRYRSLFLAILTLGFLATFDLISAAFLVALTVTTYFLTTGKFLTKYTIIAAIALVAFIIINYKLQVSNDPFDAIQDVAMPLGISYYSFRIIHYLIDKYLEALPEHNFADYVGYLFFVPTLVVGPIHRFSAFKRDRDTIEWRAESLSEGMERILIGYFKIVVIGNFLLSNVLARQINFIEPSNQSLILYLEAVRGSLNLYFQFAGYSSVAIGFALLLGYRVMENFNNPFLTPNIAEFWRCWHISLTSWSRDYVYMPVMSITRSPQLGTLASLIVVGMWHELSLRYILWGAYHGLGIIVVNTLQRHRRRRGAGEKRETDRSLRGRSVWAFKCFLTANYFFFGYILVHERTLGEAFETYYTIFFGWY